MKTFLKTMLVIYIFGIIVGMVLCITYRETPQIGALQLDSGANKQEADRVNKLKEEDLKLVIANYVKWQKEQADMKLVVDDYINWLKNQCNLSFTSEKDGKIINPPTWFVDRISGYGCKDKMILTRLAYYESNFNPEARNHWFYGLYQLGQGDTKQFCANNGKDDSDEQCALFLYNFDRVNQFETVKVYFNSFNF